MEVVERVSDGICVQRKVGADNVDKSPAEIRKDTIE